VAGYQNIRAAGHQNIGFAEASGHQNSEIGGGGTSYHQVKRSPGHLIICTTWHMGNHIYLQDMQ
jgi:hypothetical protein